MNSRQEAKLNMYRAIEKQNDDNPTIISTVAAYQTAFNKFKSNIAAINQAAQQKDVPLTGIAADKNNLKQALCKKAAEIAGIIYAYASANADETLKAEVNFTYSALIRTRDDALAPRCQNIHDRAAANQAALADYGIKPAALTELQTAIDVYSAATPKPRTAVSQRKTMKTNLDDLFKETDRILHDQLDKLVITFKTAHPDFVKTYESNRIIVDPPSKTVEMKEPTNIVN